MKISQNQLETVTTSHVKEGSVVKGQVVETTSEVIVVDVGLKNEGRIQQANSNLLEDKNSRKWRILLMYMWKKLKGEEGLCLAVKRPYVKNLGLNWKKY